MPCTKLPDFEKGMEIKMKIYDISQELFGSFVFPGDITPKWERVLKISEGSPCNLTNLTMCVHNGTHVDAPYHFLDDGKTIESLDLDKCIGMATLVTSSGILEEEEARKIIETCEKRLLIKGDVLLSAAASEVFAEAGIILIGIEASSIDQGGESFHNHYTLLKKGIVIVEGLRMGDVTPGNYLLNCAPLNLAGCDGSPCRAVLIDLEKE